MKRKIGLSLLIFVALIFIAAFASIGLFKQRVVDSVTSEIGKQTSLRVEFSDIDVGVFGSFPNVELGLSNLSVVGADVEADSILFCKRITTRVGIGAIFGGSIAIKSFDMDEPIFHLQKRGEGKVRRASNRPGKKLAKAENESAFELDLKRLQIINGKVVSVDAVANRRIELDSINTTVSGKINMKEGRFVFNTAANLNIMQAGQMVYNGLPIAIDAEIGQKMGFRSVSIDKLLVEANGFEIGIKGNWHDAGRELIADIDFESKDGRFEQIVGCLPSSVASRLSDMQLSGVSKLEGSIKGNLLGRCAPFVDVQFMLKDGAVGTKDGSELLSKLNLSMGIQQNGVERSKWTAKTSRCDAWLGDEPIKLAFRADDLGGDTRFELSFDGGMDLKLLKPFVSDDLVLKGDVAGRFSTDGKWAHLQQAHFDSLHTSGTIRFSNFMMKQADMVYALRVDGAKMELMTNRINLKQSKARFGSSQFGVTGNFSNYYGYLIHNQELKGDVNVKSTTFNLNELLLIHRRRAKAATADTLSQDKEERSVRLPKRVDLKLRVDVDRMVYDSMKINKLNGRMMLKNQMLYLTGLKMEMLGGKMALKGKLDGKTAQPQFNFGFDIDRFDIDEAWKQMRVFRHLAPIAQGGSGRFSSKLMMKGALDKSWKPIMPSLNGAGSITTSRIVIRSSQANRELRKVLELRANQPLTIDAFNANYRVENGGLVVPGFDARIIGQKLHVKGRKSVDDRLDFDVAIDLDRAYLKREYDDILSVLPGSENIKVVKTDLHIGGTVKKPVIKLDISRAKKQVAKQLKKASLKDWSKKLRRFFK